MTDFRRIVVKMTQPLTQRVLKMVRRAVVTLVDDSLAMQGLQLTALDKQVIDGAEHFQPYGFTSVPLAGAEAIVANVGGAYNHPVVLVVDDRRYRMKALADGEVAIYTDEGDYIHIKRGGTIDVVAATKVNITAPDVAMSGNLQVAGSTTLTGPVTAESTLAATGALTSASSVGDPTGTMADMRGDYNSHAHGGSPDPSPQML